MSASSLFPGRTERAVEIVEVFGEWHVRVVENGKEFVTTFPMESFAISYAEGRRIRLCLDKFDRL